MELLNLFQLTHPLNFVQGVDGPRAGCSSGALQGITYCTRVTGGVHLLCLPSWVWVVKHWEKRPSRTASILPFCSK